MGAEAILTSEDQNKDEVHLVSAASFILPAKSFTRAFAEAVSVNDSHARGYNIELEETENSLKLTLRRARKTENGRIYLTRDYFKTLTLTFNEQQQSAQLDAEVQIHYKRVVENGTELGKDIFAKTVASSVLNPQDIIPHLAKWFNQNLDDDIKIDQNAHIRNILLRYNL